MKNLKLLVKTFFLFTLFLLSKNSSAQVPTPITVTSNPTILDIQNLLFGPDVKVSNLVINCPGAALGTFSGPNSNLGLTSGLLLTTGTVANAVGPNNAPDKGTDNMAPGDKCLENYIGGTGGTPCVVGGACTQAGCNGTNTNGNVCTCSSCQGSGATSYDACSIEFDIIPTCDSLKINYVFASEEYPEYVNSNVSDAFAFFISGPGISGGGCNNSMNMAIVPGTGTLVSIDNINASTNSQYYVNNKNTIAAGVQYDAFTKVLTAKAKVIPCSSYHIKVVIADFGDGIYDSGVFLQKGGISCGAPSLTVTKTDAIECCKNGSFILTLAQASPTPLTISYSLSGTATSGTDYTALPGSVTFPAGQTVVTIPVSALCDGIAEGSETITLSIGQAVCAGVITGSATLTITDPPTANAGVDKTICPASGGANLTATGGGTYLWTPSAGLSCTTCANPIATPSVTTTYTVTVTDAGGCTATDAVVISVSCGPLVIATGSTICIGGMGTLTATGSAGTSPYTYSWSPNTNLSSTTGSSITASPTVTTVYTVTLTDNAGKTATANATVTVNPPPTITLSSASVCPGACATINATGGISYSWSAPFNGSTSTQSACPVATTTYSVTGTDANGCTNTASATVTVNTLPTVTVTNLTVCKDTTGSITASGASTYVWSCGGTGASIKPNTSVLGTSTCTVTGTDINGCKNTATSTIQVNDCSKPSVSVVSGSVCTGSCYTITAVGTGGVGALTYVWNPNLGTGAGPFNVCPASTSSYTVIVSDANGVTASAAATVTVDPLITLNLAPVNVTCFGACNGQTIVIPSGGNGTFTYSWSGGCVNAACNNVCAGTYTLTTTDGVGCTATGSTVVTEPPALTVANASTKVSCFGVCDGTASVTAGGGTPPYTYSWTPGGGAVANVVALCAGSYTCTVTDANGCSIKTAVTITQPTKVVVTSTGASLCPNECTTLISNCSGGTAPYNYSWSPGGSTAASVSVCPVNTSVYTVTTVDANGCSGGTSVTVTVNPAPVISVPAATICEKTSTTLVASGANTYTWSPATGLSNPIIGNPVASPTVTTTYTITGKNTFGCTASTTVIVTVQPAPILAATGGNACSGDSIPLSVSGAVSYSWSPAKALNTTSGANVIAKPVTTTTYIITGTSANGCTSTIAATATVNPKPKPSFTTSPAIVDEFNPTIYFYDHSTGGIMTKWNWNLGDTSNTISHIQNPVFTYPNVSGTYPIRLIVTNQFGCIDTINGSVYIRGIFTFYIPNTFTPNNDGNNDGFMPKGVGIDESDYDLWIFDRWGNLIWHTSIWGDAWDGRANHGADITQIDTYVWKVHVKEKETGTKHNYIGHVNIVK